MSFSASIIELVESSALKAVSRASHWERVPLQSVVDVLNGYPFSSERFNEKEGHPLLRIRDVTSGDTETYFLGQVEDGYWVEPGDIVVGMDGDFNLRLWRGKRALLNQRVCKLTVDERFYSKHFLAYALPGYLGLINSETHSVTVKHLSSRTVQDIPLPLPSLPEQHRIVAKIDSLFARSSRARDELARIPRLIERYRQAVLEAAFRGELTADWRSKHPNEPSASVFIAERQRAAIQIAASAGIGRDVKAALLISNDDLTRDLDAKNTTEPLPEGWEWAGIGQAFGVYIGATPSRKEATYWCGHVPWVSSGEVAFTRISDTTEKITAEGLANTSTRLHPPGTVLLGMIGEGKTRGQAAILDIPACNNQNCAAIRVSEAGYSPEYLYWYFVAVYEQTRTVGSGNGPQALNKDRVQRLLVPLAPAAEAVEVAKRVGEMLAPLSALQQEVRSALGLVTRLDASILDKAFSGKLVPQDPNDEPASALLERIRAARAEAPKPKRARRAKG